MILVNRMETKVLAILFFFPLFSFATDYTWVGTSADWGTSSNWSPSGVPGSSDKVIINTSGSVNPVLDQSRSVSSIDFNTKTLDLNGYTLTVTGDASFTSGTVNNGSLIVQNSGTGGFSVSGDVTFGCSVSATAPSVVL